MLPDQDFEFMEKDRVIFSPPDGDINIGDSTRQLFNLEIHSMFEKIRWI